MLLSYHHEFFEIDLLGSGSFARVFHARSRVNSTDVAIKVLQAGPHDSDAKASSLQKAFETETHILKKCRSPFIVNHIRSFSKSPLPRAEMWIVMEHCEFGTLSDLIKTRQQGMNVEVMCGYSCIPEDCIRYACASIVLALEYLHPWACQGDLKCANILIDAMGTVKLADFGVSVTRSEYYKKDRDEVAGSTFWMAPEVCMLMLQEERHKPFWLKELLRREEQQKPYCFNEQDSWTLKTKQDMWSLGIAVYEMVNGDPPHFKDIKCEDPIYLAKAIVEQKAPTLPDPDADSDMRNFLSCCFQKDPNKRPNTVTLSRHPFIQKDVTELRSSYFRGDSTRVSPILDLIQNMQGLTSQPNFSNEYGTERTSHVNSDHHVQRILFIPPKSVFGSGTDTVSPKRKASKRPRSTSFDRVNNDRISFSRTFGNPQIVPYPSLQSNKNTGIKFEQVAPYLDRSLDELVGSLSETQRACCYALKGKWEHHDGDHFPGEYYLRFARSKDFDFVMAWEAIRAFDTRYLGVSIDRMESQLLEKKIFPIPGLLSRQGHRMFYMRVGRLIRDPTETILDSIFYTTFAMHEHEDTWDKGIGVILNMADWTVSRHDIYPWDTLLEALFGKSMPVKVTKVLVVNPPSGFSEIWRMLYRTFQENLLEVPVDDFGGELMEGFERFLPDDVVSGNKVTVDMLSEIIEERMAVEMYRQDEQRDHLFL